MTGPELGFVLLCSHLGDPDRKVLTATQLERLRALVGRSPKPEEGHMSEAYLRGLGLNGDDAQGIARLFSQQALAVEYVKRAERLGIRCLTWKSPGYPRRLRETMGTRAPSVLWLWGNEGLLDTAAVALVGARDAGPESLTFAGAVGAAAARQGFTLVSGGARGCDSAGECACLSGGGRVIRVLPDAMHRHERPGERLLYLCEDSFDLPFSPHRALSRNRLIHSLGRITMVGQSGLRGGTWDGTTQNLSQGWSPVYLWECASPGARALMNRGAHLLPSDGLKNLSALMAE